MKTLFLVYCLWVAGIAAIAGMIVPIKHTTTSPVSGNVNTNCGLRCGGGTICVQVDATGKPIRFPDGTYRTNSAVGGISAGLITSQDPVQHCWILN